MILHIDSIIKTEWKFLDLKMERVHSTSAGQVLISAEEKFEQIVVYQMVPVGEYVLVLYAPVEPILPPKGSHRLD